MVDLLPAYCLACGHKARFDPETGDLECPGCGYIFSFTDPESYKRAFCDYGPKGKQLAGSGWEAIEKAEAKKQAKSTRRRRRSRSKS